MSDYFNNAHVHGNEGHIVVATVRLTNVFLIISEQLRHRAISCSRFWIHRQHLLVSFHFIFSWDLVTLRKHKIPPDFTFIILKVVGMPFCRVLSYYLEHFEHCIWVSHLSTFHHQWARKSWCPLLDVKAVDKTNMAAWSWKAVVADKWTERLKMGLIFKWWHQEWDIEWTDNYCI